MSGRNAKISIHSSEGNVISTQYNVKFKWLKQQTKPLDDFYLDNIKAINTYLDRHSNGKLRWKEIYMT